MMYFFGGDETEGDAGMRDLLGGKGANLAEMAKLGLPVPPGFTITTEVCRYFVKNGKLPDGFEEEFRKYLRKLEEVTGKKFGDPKNPLLVSVRSGAKFSMPGMMDTILNIGLNDEIVKGLAELTGNERFAYDAYRRLIQMFGNVVMGIDKNEFEKHLEEMKKKRGVAFDSELTAEDLKELVEIYKRVYKEHTGEDFPQDPEEQLRRAVIAVFKSWNNPRAITYRRLNKIPDDLGTAANVQTMVFGNLGEDSGTGVGFTRNPATGEKELYGEYLTNAQGEDVVAGIRTPMPISKLKEENPKLYEELRKVAELLERHYRDVQDFEFTVERGKLYILQTRDAKRTPLAAVKIAVDMANEGLISKEEAILRIDPENVVKLLQPVIDPSAKVDPIARGLPASPGAVSGRVVFSADEAVEKSKEGPVILVRPETSPDDIHGMHASVGILTSRGGMTSHAAVVARGMGRPCVVGCEELQIDEERREIRVKDIVIKEGEWITIDGYTGNVMVGKVPTIEPQIKGELETLLRWADEFRRLGVRANADTPEDARRAREFGAEGIGLCRTEHMFFHPSRIPSVLKMIMAETPEERREALAEIYEYQRNDFYEIFREMEGLPVTIRTLDMPLHEFLPKREELRVEIERMRARGEDEEKIKEKERLLRRVEELYEFNPMLGHRGCRLGITYPEITEMQARAIIEAACMLKKEGKTVIPEIMIPLVSHVNELKDQKEIVKRVAEEVMKEHGVEIEYSVGVMVEVPRAAVTADRIAKEAEFFSFGTNDLTQMSFGFSRDDYGKFIEVYKEKKILPEDPFTTLDQEGVGELMRIAVERGKSSNPNLKTGICGEHGGDPRSIEFCHRIGLDYVSSSPYRIPVARLAAAQAALKKLEGTVRKDV
ncbi:MAG: pyruvate, phosphate dikinase [Archaeoglobi archaeon]|nr:pyruvate, phosphate dikinase [Candidatus Mnemosynella bozhongmuii]